IARKAGREDRGPLPLPLRGQRAPSLTGALPRGGGEPKGGLIMRSCKIQAWLCIAVMCAGLWAVPLALAEEQPQRGGVLRVATAGDPPSLDMHQEQTFMVTIPLSPLYNAVVMFAPHNYPKIIGDLAKTWTASADGLTYTFTLQQGIKFHDGSELTSADVKASWDKIVFPSEGVVSTRKTYYQMV